MEVHHHSNSHGKKNFKTYFWEFLMLFLAVFCGFLAEYQLEHQIEKDKEKEFIQSFIDDLKTDTAAIRLSIDAYKNKMVIMDSLMVLLREQNIKGHENELYYFGRMLVRTNRFQSNDRTITQLKNSGALRLIRNEQAADSIMSYQKLVDRVMGNQEDDRTERFNTFPIISKMFNPFIFDEMVSSGGVSRPEGNPPLRSYDQNLQMDLAFYVHQIKGSNFLLRNRLELLQTKAKSTMTFLKQEYHLN